MTSRLETSRYRDFSQFFESIGLGLENFGLEKSLGIGLDEIFWSRHSVLGDRQYGVMFVLVVWFLGYDWKTSILGQIVHDLSKLIGQTPLPENYNHTIGGKISRCILTMRRGTYGMCELVKLFHCFDGSCCICQFQSTSKQALSAIVQSTDPCVSSPFLD